MFFSSGLFGLLSIMRVSPSHSHCNGLYLLFLETIFILFQTLMLAALCDRRVIIVATRAPSSSATNKPQRVANWRFMNCKWMINESKAYREKRARSLLQVLCAPLRSIIVLFYTDLHAHQQQGAGDRPNGPPPPKYVVKSESALQHTGWQATESANPLLSVAYPISIPIAHACARFVRNRFLFLRASAVPMCPSPHPASH